MTQKLCSIYNIIKNKIIIKELSIFVPSPWLRDKWFEDINKLIDEYKKINVKISIRFVILPKDGKYKPEGWTETLRVEQEQLGDYIIQEEVYLIE